MIEDACSELTHENIYLTFEQNIFGKDIKTYFYSNKTWFCCSLESDHNNIVSESEMFDYFQQDELSVWSIHRHDGLLLFNARETFMNTVRTSQQRKQLAHLWNVSARDL